MQRIREATIGLGVVALQLLLVAFMATSSAEPGGDELEARDAAAIRALRQGLQPLSPGVARYDSFLAELDSAHIVSIVKALDEYRKRFVSSPQEDRDKAFVLFHLAYMRITRESRDFVCTGLDEPADHIPTVKKVADKAGLEVHGDAEGGANFGPRSRFLLDTFKGWVSADVVEFLRLKAKDLETGTMGDGEFSLSVAELGERCAKWGVYLQDHPRSIVKPIAQAHYDRDLDLLVRGDAQGNEPFDETRSGPKKRVGSFIETYRHIVQAYPSLPLACLLRDYLKLWEETGSIDYEKGNAFLKSRNVPGRYEALGLSFVGSDTCRSPIPWDQIQRECLGHAGPAVGVIDTATGKAIRVRYSATGIPYPGETYKREYVLLSAPEDKTFFTLVERSHGEASDAGVASRDKGLWNVREFDADCQLLRTLPVELLFDGHDFERRYFYHTQNDSVLGPGVLPRSAASSTGMGTIIGGPTASGAVAVFSRTDENGGNVTLHSCKPTEQRTLFSDRSLVAAGVSPSMRFVAAVLDLGAGKLSELRLVDTTTGENRLVASAGTRLYGRVPVWSPDSRIVAYPLSETLHHDAILLYLLESGETRRITPDVCKEEGSVLSLVFLEPGRLFYHYWQKKGDKHQWIAMDIATGKTLWTLPDRMEYATVFDSGRKIACYFPEARR